MGSYFRLLTLLTCDHVFLCKFIDDVFEFRPFIVANLLAVNTANSILKHDTSDYTGLILLFLLLICHCMVQKIIENFSSNLVA